MKEAAQSLQRADIAWLAGVLGIVAAAAFLATRTARLPFEDAAMLMRYAEHIASGHGFTWNIGEPPVDGATDFLTTLLMAGLVQLGLTPEDAGRGLAIGAHLGTVATVFLGLRAMLGVRLPLAVLASVYTGLSAGLAYIAVFFTTSVFACLAALVALLGVRLTRGSVRLGHVLAYGAACLLLGLARPEGVILGGLISGALAMVVGRQAARRYVVAYAVFVLGLGSLYLLWRWSYFGHFLPNPFYRKGGGAFHFDGFRSGIKNTLLHGAALWLLLGGIACVRRSRLLWATLAIGVAFASIWGLLSDEMNYLGRFQFATLPVLAILVTCAAQEAWDQLFAARARAVAAALSLVFGLGTMMSLYRAFVRVRPLPDGRYDVALELRGLRTPSAVLVTTEAGLLPYYSDWRAVDAWGLNDAWIAQNQGITAAYLESKRPTLIMYHGAQALGRTEDAAGSWGNMLDVLFDYTQAHGFVLAATFATSPGRAHHYFVDPNAENASTLIDTLRRVPYASPATGEFVPALY